ncbi:MAG: hypothetical protein ACI3VA_07095 [Candidatus Limivicinus sp.]
MKIERIAKILDAHCVPYFVSDGRIFADTMEAFAQPLEHVEDLTDYTHDELYAWLGY